MKRAFCPRPRTIAAATAVALAFGAQAATITVTSNADSGAGSLRAALATIQADTSCTGAPYLVNFGTGGPTVIALLSSLPPVTCPATIDGYAQTGLLSGTPTGAVANSIPLARNGSNASPKIVLDGAPMTGGYLMFIGAPNSVVKGLVFQNYPTGGSAISNNANNVSILGNFIGVSANGLACATRPGNTGIILLGALTNVGSANPADRNVIGCHSTYGMLISSTGNVIKGNLIGAGVDASTALGNAFGVFSNSSTQTIGGQAAGEGNVIAHNTTGVSFANVNGIVISGNDMFQNPSLGIDVGNNGPTPNNANLFPSSLPNSGQNFPVISAVTYTPTTTTIAGTFFGFSNTTSGMEFFDNAPLLGIDQGFYAGTSSLPIVTPPAPFSVTLPGAIRNPSATGFTTSGGTSEMSAIFPVPEATVSPSTSIGFPVTAVGTGIAGPAVTLTNSSSSNTPLTITAITSSAPSEFFDFNALPANLWCGLGPTGTGSVTLPGGGSCTLNLVFLPQSSGTRNATITVNTGNKVPGGNPVLTLAGSGSVVQPTTTVGFAPGAVLPNVPSNLTLQIANPPPNGAPFTNPNFTVPLPAGLVVAPVPNATNPVSPCSGAFTPPTPGATSFTINGLSVPTNGVCGFSLDLVAASPGSYPLSLSAGNIVGQILGATVSNAASNVAILAVASPAILLTPPSLSFGSVLVGTTAGPQPLVVTNTGGAPLVFSSPPTASGDYSLTTTCAPATPLAAAPGPGNTCNVNVSFTPTATGVRTGNVTIASNVPGSPTLVPITGTGSAVPAPAVTLTPPSLTFASQTVGTTSPPQSVSLANVGTAPLNISGVFSSGDFAQSSACGTTLAPSATCPISVTFTPIISGARTGDIKVFDDAAGSPQTVPLNGNGVALPVPTVVAPSAIPFPTTQVGSVSSPVAVTVSNGGIGNLNISAVQVVGGGFVLSSDTCTGASIATSGTCSMGVTFAPYGAGPIAATLRIISNAPASPTLITLTGTGTAAPVGTLVANPASLSFGQQVIATTSAAQPILVSNTGSATVNVSAVNATGDYAQSNNCTVIAGGGTCTVSVTFTPTLTGARTGAISIASDASNSPLSVPLAGSGAPVPAPVIELSVSSLTFGNRLMGAGSTTQPITLKNVGGAALNIDRIYTAGDFVQANNCPTIVNPGGTCRLDVGFAASVPGPRTGKVVILSNAQGGPKEAQLAGTGCRIFSLTGSRTGALFCQ